MTEVTEAIRVRAVEHWVSGCRQCKQDCPPRRERNAA
jgi:hypothetical protein